MLNKFQVTLVGPFLYVSRGCWVAWRWVAEGKFKHSIPTSICRSIPHGAAYRRPANGIYEPTPNLGNFRCGQPPWHVSSQPSGSNHGSCLWATAARGEPAQRGGLQKGGVAVRCLGALHTADLGRGAVLQRWAENHPFSKEEIQGIHDIPHMVNFRASFLSLRTLQLAFIALGTLHFEIFLQKPKPVFTKQHTKLGYLVIC